MSETPDTLPTECPKCGKVLETREDVMVELFTHPEVWSE